MAEDTKQQRELRLTDSLAPETIGFRLSPEDRKLLQTHAFQAGVSPHVLARTFVEQILRSGGSIGALFALHEEVMNARAELEALRLDLAHATAVLLVSAGSSTPEKAKVWVEKNLRGRDS
jgi:hypothetical protein